MLFVRSEFSYDKFHSKADRIYRVWEHEKYEGQDFINTATPLIMASALQSTYPEIEATCRIFGFTPMVRIGHSSFSESARLVDSTFFKIFDFHLIQGDKKNPFPTSNSIILTPDIAKKYFGKENPLGKNVEIQLGTEKVLFTVTGIAKRAPEASSIKYNILIPFSNSKLIFSANAHKSWFNIYTETYVLFKDRVDPLQVEKKIPAMMKQQLGEDYTEGGFLLYFQPITKIHLDTVLPAGIEPTSNSKYSYILATIGMLILLVACINFITLSIGRSSTRAMEVGVRKVMGAQRRQLIRQFWGEAFLLTLISVLVGLLLSSILVEPFNRLIQRQLSIEFDLTFISFALIIIGLIGLVAGIYPAIILSGFNPVEVLKGKLRMKGNKGWLHQSLIIGQFVASIAMIICTIAIGEQMKYLQSKDLGYSRDQVIVVPTNKRFTEGYKLAELYTTELKKHNVVEAVTTSLYSFAQTPWVELGYTDDKRVYREFQYNSVDPEFIPAMKMKMAAGRSFDKSNPADVGGSAIVNEAFVAAYGIKEPVGKKLPGRFDQQIIGVVKDFHFESLHTKIRPLMLTILPDSIFRRSENMNIAAPMQPRVSVRLQSGNTANNIAILKAAWKKVAPTQDFEYNFLDETIASQYEAEQRTSSIVKIASALSIFIACMGLFGLATLTVVRRTKEIGIRKVLGATIPGIVGLLSKDFVRLIIIAALVAFPLAWWAMNNWLQDFEYRTAIGWWVYLIAGIVALLIALITVSLQATKAAISNPVKSLRTE